MPTYPGCVCCPAAGQDTTCCPDDLVPEELFCTFSGYTLGCACANGTVITLTYVPLSSWTWTGSGTLGMCGTTIFIIFSCDGGSGQWRISANCTAPPPTATTNASSGTCSPFSQTYLTFSVGGDCCAAMVTGTVTVTE